MAKFTNNPQGNRSLINECLAGHLLSALGVMTPVLAVLHLGDACQGREELYFSTGEGQEPIVNGSHLGSKCPVNPDSVAIFDFLPRDLYSRVSNLSDVGTVFAFDHWVAHADARQFIFARKSNPRKTSGLPVGKGLLTVWAIDNGMCFGRDWMLTDQLLPGGRLEKSYRSSIYRHCGLETSATNGAHRIQSFPASGLQAARQNIPPDWFAPGDEAAIEAMLEVLQERQQSIVKSLHTHLAFVVNQQIRAS